MAGSKEAMAFMSRAYLTGMFGAIDSEKGYMYLLPQTMRDDSTAMKELLQSVRTRLAPSARLAAERAAFGCGTTPAALSNPFARN
jgi:hypothetical protein